METNVGGVSIACKGARSGRTVPMTVLWSGQPADDRDDELELVDDDPEPDVLDDLCDRDED